MPFTCYLIKKLTIWVNIFSFYYVSSDYQYKVFVLILYTQIFIGFQVCHLDFWPRFVFSHWEMVFKSLQPGQFTTLPHINPRTNRFLWKLEIYIGIVWVYINLGKSSIFKIKVFILLTVLHILLNVFLGSWFSSIVL